MGIFYYCDDCMEGGPTTTEATHLDVVMWNGKTRDLCEECYNERKQEGDLQEEESCAQTDGGSK